MERNATYGLTHIAVAVRDLQRTLKFYTHIFDMDVMYNEEDFIQLTTPDSHDILVFQRSTDKNVGISAGIAHFGFRLREPTDMGLILKKIDEAGGKIKEQGEFVPGSPYVFFYDPDGYEVEVWYELIP